MRPVCVHCGAKYGQRHTVSQEVRWPANQPMPDYCGNGVVVKTGAVSKLRLKADYLAEEAKRSMNHFARGRTPPDPRFYTDEPTLHAYREVWDGVSWHGGYHPFCTLRCALEYARNAWRSGQAAP
jgi:hypothetical protein